MANPGDFAVHREAAGGHRPHRGRVRQAAQERGAELSGLCPFHREKTPSFSVHATRQFFHCFGCGVSGDVFSFVQKIENITFPEAVRLVAEKLGIPLPKVSYSSPAEAKEARLRGRLLDIHERACAFFQEYLRRPEGAHAREYLAARGLTPETIAASASAMRRIPASCCVTRCEASSAKNCCARADCFRGRTAKTQLSAVSSQTVSR